MLKEDSARCPGCMSLITGDKICPRCGYSKDSAHDANYISPGTTLYDGRYLVGIVASKNGEGATYVGFDKKNSEPCWIREYFPTTLARRDAQTGKVSPQVGYGAQYKALISDFVDVCNEVKRLAITENVVPILDSFPENGTYYAIYQSLKLVTLENYLKRGGGKLPLQKALDLFLPLCDMVGAIHDHGHLHRGISPYTIYVDDEEALYLWGFELGAARTANSELDAELYNGYSAPEQYATNGWQGTWTDIYALAAVFYRMVSGFVPPKSTLVGDDRPIATLDDLVMDMPKNISDAISDAMKLSTEERTQAVYSFTSRFMDAEPANTAIYDTNKTKRHVRQEEPREKDGSFKYAILALIFTAVTLLCGFVYMTKTLFPSMMEEPKPPERTPVSDPLFSESQPESSQDAANDTKVPRFVGQMLSFIENDSDYTKFFNFSVQHAYNDEFAEGVIYKQSPEENTPMPNRGTVILYVSKGPELAMMPNVIGMSWEEALKILGQQNLDCDKVERYASGAKAGSVVGTSPSPGTKFDPKKEPVVVYVAPGGSQGSSQTAPSNSSDNPASSADSGSSQPASSSKEESSSKPPSSSKDESSSGEFVMPVPH